ncbi:50S ribosomal protein L3 [Candidatus Geothermarchaeota archaeon]|nr:MAG: 50S ribosomal protein L3 [Candidatus Geothermarchaeota archaeon]
MGARKKHAPKRGSLAFLPKKRAKSIVPTIKTWPELEVNRPVLLGFAGYKAGMTGVVYIENNPNSPDYGKEIYTAATVVETPPIFVLGIVAYHVLEEKNALGTFCTAYAKDVPDFIKRRIVTISTKTSEENLKRIEENLDEVVKFRILAAMQPHLAGIHKKTPEVFELEIGGKVSIEEKFEYAKSILGKTVKVSEVFKPGDLIDVIAVTKGKGFQGPVKRWGIKTLPPKSRKCKRKPGALGPWTPSAVMYTVPGAGQLGFHRRTIYRIKILDVKTVEDKKAVLNVPFHKYGVLKNSYLILMGSVPGPAKRIILMRHTIRPIKVATPPPEIIYVQRGV